MQAEWEALDTAGRARVMSRQGVPYPHAVHLRIVDEAMNDVPADAETLGEVVMRGNNVMRGYFQDPEATAEAFRGGWFHSGDLGVMHPDGYIELRDRSKDIVISGGENISTIEVENTLYQHPDVQEVAVIGIPDEKWGEVPKALRGGEAWHVAQRGRADRLRARAALALQVPAQRRLRRAPEDGHRQDPEVQAARANAQRRLRRILQREPVRGPTDPASRCRALGRRGAAALRLSSAGGAPPAGLGDGAPVARHAVHLELEGLQAHGPDVQVVVVGEADGAGELVGPRRRPGWRPRSRRRRPTAALLGRGACCQAAS